VARWPGKIKANTVTSELGHSNDLLPTICSAAGVSVPESLHIDGINLLPLLTDRRQASARGPVFWQLDLYKHLQRHYPKPKPYATEVVRQGRWKLLALNGKPLALFDVEADISEQNNLIKQEPERTKALAQQLAAWLAEPRQGYGMIK
jgi:N-acetylgalactosamine-6-sulfatase